MHGSHLVSYSLQASPDTMLLSSHPQSLGLSRVGELTQPPSPSPQPKGKRVSLAKSGERHTEVYHYLIPRLDVVICTALNVAWHTHCLYSLVKATLVFFLGNSCATGQWRGHIDCVPRTNCTLLFHNVMYYYITRQWSPQRVMYKTVSLETAYVQM